MCFFLIVSFTCFPVFFSFVKIQHNPQYLKYEHKIELLLFNFLFLYLSR